MATKAKTASMFYGVDLALGYYNDDEPEVEASQLHRGKPFAGLALGLFRDMYGNEVDLRELDLSIIVRNTLAAIGYSQSKNMPGLPIDARGHDKMDAAGWIVSAEAGQVTDSEGVTLGAVILTADWTVVGQDLIGKRILTNFSPTVEIEPTPVIRGGSLTNWPASVDKAGNPLFNALELSQGSTVSEETNMPQDEVVQELDEVIAPATEPTQALPQAPAQADLAQLVAAEVAKALANLSKPAAQPAKPAKPPAKPAKADPEAVAAAADEGANRVETIAALLGLTGDAVTDFQQSHLDSLAKIYEERAKIRWERRLAQIQRDNAITELSAKLVGGTASSPRGLPADEEQLVANLSALPGPQYAYFSDLLTQIVERGLVDFSELGHGRRRRGTEQLPEIYAAALRRGELTVSDLSGPVLAQDLGDIARYDLTEFER